MSLPAFFLALAFTLAVPALAGCTASHGPPLAAPSEKAFVCGIVCDVVVSAPQGWAGEPSLAVDPADPSHLVAGAIEFATAPSGQSNFWVHSYESRDAGATWSGKALTGGVSSDPSHPLFPYTSTGDPWLVFLDDGTVLLAGIAARDAQVYSAGGVVVLTDLAVFVARSHDGGASFPDVAIVAEGHGAVGTAYVGPAGAPILTPMDIPDKEAMAVGPEGEIVLTWTQFQIPSQRGDARATAADIMVAISRDAGATWSPPAAVARGTFQGSAPAIAQDGSIHVAFLRNTPEAFDRQVETDLFVASSRDGGGTWETRRVGAAAALNFPSLAVDGGSGERIIVAYAAPGASEEASVPSVLVSLDGGVTWDGPRALDTPEGRGRPMPSVAIGADGTAFIGYYHALASEGAHEYRMVALPREGGNGTRAVLSREVASPGFAQRDYATVVATEDGAVAVWTGGSYPRAEVRFSRAEFV